MCPTRIYRRCLNAKVDIQMNPFAFSNIHLSLEGNSVVGLGSCTARFSGTSTGIMYFDGEGDFYEKQFKLHCSIGEDNSLRIDFVELNKSEQSENYVGWKDTLPQSPDYEMPKLVYLGTCPETPESEELPFPGVIAFERIGT